MERTGVISIIRLKKVRCLWLTSPRRDTQTVTERIVELTGADVLH
ncbi:hypothetical protein [Phocaeicola dorei]|nr:hypothetical protein [Phocaeicola dorei]